VPDDWEHPLLVLEAQEVGNDEVEDAVREGDFLSKESFQEVAVGPGVRASPRFASELRWSGARGWTPFEARCR